MIPVSSDQIDNMHDAMNLMQIFGDRLLRGEVTDEEASRIAWLLGSAKKRLEPVLYLLEKIEFEQERRPPAELEIIDEFNDLQKRWDALKAKLEGKA